MIRRPIRSEWVARVQTLVIEVKERGGFQFVRTRLCEDFDPPKTEPPIVTPGRTPSDPPSDAIVLFDGRDLSAWRSAAGSGEAKWTIRDGYMEVAARTGDIATKQEFGDCQLHIEWATPAEVKGTSQERGNSGVFLMERYEVQVLDSYDNKTYFHGQAGAIYKQYAPQVNACRKPGEWQTYDIAWTAPTFNSDGTLKSPAYVTVFFNDTPTVNGQPAPGGFSNEVDFGNLNRSTTVLVDVNGFLGTTPPVRVWPACATSTRLSSS